MTARFLALPVLLALLAACSDDVPAPVVPPASRPAGDAAPDVSIVHRPLTDADLAHFLSIENEVVTRLGLPPTDPSRQGPFVQARQAIVRSRGLDPQAYEELAARIYAAILPARVEVSGAMKPGLKADVDLVRRHLGTIDSLMQRKRALATATKPN